MKPAPRSAVLMWDVSAAARAAAALAASHVTPLESEMKAVIVRMKGLSTGVAHAIPPSAVEAAMAMTQATEREEQQ